jgi:GNAT superfamily N-acetyltransferase
VRRPLTLADLPAAMTLVNQVGWNQTIADWARFVNAEPAGCFATSLDGHLVGTAATIIYDGQLAWIGMVIVDSAYRGRGIGRELLESVLDFLDGRGIPCVKLDATPAGKPVYEKFGFVGEREIMRLALVRPSCGAPQPSAAPRAVMNDVLRLDRQLFGVDRGELLRSLAVDAPELAVVIREGTEIIGYAFGRHGGRADHLGPWMARDGEAAARVLDTCLERSERPLVYVDCIGDNPWALRIAEARGFQLSRALTRMCRGANLFPGTTKYLGAIVGPEFG